MNMPSDVPQRLVSAIASLVSTAISVGFKCLVRCYQVMISPFVQPRCRFHPTCSHYAMEALETHGPLTGGALAAKRLARCHPWTEGGVDFVPKPNTDGSID
jgi:putative membrane protein insertion efficiency factor